MKQPPAKFESFGSWSDAFDYCREADHPVVVCVSDPEYGLGSDVNYEYAKLFPSGRCKTLYVVRNRPIQGKVS